MIIWTFPSFPLFLFICQAAVDAAVIAVAAVIAIAAVCCVVAVWLYRCHCFETPSQRLYIYLSVCLSQSAVCLSVQISLDPIGSGFSTALITICVSISSLCTQFPNRGRNQTSRARDQESESNPTEHFAILEPQNPSVVVSKLHKISRSADYKALKLCDVQSGGKPSRIVIHVLGKWLLHMSAHAAYPTGYISKNKKQSKITKTN